MTTETIRYECKSVAELQSMPAEYRAAVEKIVVSHAVNELAGAQAFDEPAIALAPTPYAKYLTCRIAMEEYHHHVRFRQLAEEMGVDPARMQSRKPLSIFGFPLRTWEEFCVIKLLADYAEILQVEDLLQCSFHPLRNLGRITMPEEKFHAQFGRDFCGELCTTEEGRARVQAAIDAYYPRLPAFFGSSRSQNNEAFRRFGLKRRTNDEMRADFVARAQRLVDGELGLKLPAVPLSYEYGGVQS
jgi:ring-1,2-phenylacetyl-CoA epoxidase subunit PaaA